jgi:regulator of RNase E activity RraB
MDSADRWGREVTTPNRDGQAIEELRRLGADLSRPMHVDHFIHDLTEHAAEKVSAELAKRGFDVLVLPPDEDVPDWTIQASQAALISDESINNLRGELEILAERYGAHYDGWGAEVN